MAKCAFCEHCDLLRIEGKAVCLIQDCVIDISSDVCGYFEDYRDTVVIMDD